MTPFLNPRRLRDHPRLIGAAIWCAWGLEVLLHRGWLGGLGWVLWSDFVTLYAAGWLNRFAPDQLYDFQAQAYAQQALIAPTPLSGLNPFTYPPHVALACQALTLLPFPVALALWSGLALWLTFHAARRLWYLLPSDLRSGPLPFPQFLVLIFSFFPFLAGWRTGQNHALTLWLVVGILEMERAGRPLLAGILAGFLLYKPHFALGFLILWAVWKEFRALTAFGAVAALWLGLSLWTGGASLYTEYFARAPLLLSLPWVEGFPAIAIITPYGLLATLLPPAAQPALHAGSLVALLLLGSGLAFMARPLGGQPFKAQAPAWMLALLYPILAFPYALIHDLILLIPLLALWTVVRPTQRLLDTAVAVYLGALVLPFLGALTRLALPALLPIGVLLAMAREGLIPLPKLSQRGSPPCAAG